MPLARARFGVATAAIVTCAFAAGSAEAQVSACTRIIELSKLRSEAVTDSQAFAQYQRDFCGDYQAFRSSGAAMRAAGGYGPISAEFDLGGASVDSVAGRYCEADGSVKSAADAYRQYVDGIAPGAFDSYRNCLLLGDRNIQFAWPPTAIQPTTATFVVSNTNPDPNAFDNIRFATAPNVTCRWDPPGTGDAIRVNGQNSATLNCTRASADQAGSVTMVAATLPDAPVTVAWEQYQDGAPISVIRQLQAVTAELAAIRNSLRGAVVAYTTTTCPAGWEPYLPAQGRFVRGITTSGDRALDPDGTRAPGSIQADELKSHVHTHIQMVGDNNVDGVDSVTRYSGEHHNQQKITGATGGAETRPRNVALLFCQSR